MIVGLINYLEQNEKKRAGCFPKFQLIGKNFDILSSNIYSFENKNEDFIDFLGCLFFILYSDYFDGKLPFLLSKGNKFPLNIFFPNL